MRRVAIAPIVGILLAGLTSTVAATNAGTNACSSAAPCLSGINSAPAGSSGAGVKGMAINSYGVRGISTNSTAVLGQSSSGSVMEPGVEGESTTTSTSVYDVAGGFGLNGLTGGHVPRLGVLGIGLDTGVSGENTSSSYSVSAGVLGTDVTGVASGVVGESQATQASIQGGFAGVGTTGILEAYNDTVAGIGVYGQGAGTAEAIFGPNAYGGYFVSNATQQSAASSGYYNYGIGAESTDIAGDFYNNTSGAEVSLADATNGAVLLGAVGGRYFLLDNELNLSTAGTVTAGGYETSGDATYRQNGASGSTLLAYGTRAAAPELEDVGDAQLVNGRAIVHIDAKLADVMDRRTTYHVFLTPDGDSKGLYVAQKSPTSFVVAEQEGGRSTMSFDYRIVATPYGHERERLASAPPLKHLEMPRTMRRSGKAMHLPSFVQSPDRALRASLGAQRYANLIATKRKELARP